MKFAYADPPYLGCCQMYDHYHGDGSKPWDGGCWNDEQTHRLLILALVDEYRDGWALSLHSPSLQKILPMCPPTVRVSAWVKPFAAFKKNVRNAYTWEPVIASGGRLSSKDGAPVTRDHLSEPIQLRAGFTGAKPPRFNRWVLDMLGFIDGTDTLDDLFPGSNGMAATLAEPTLPTGVVHNHGTEDGPGLACREVLTDGQLVGACIRNSDPTSPDTYDWPDELRQTLAAEDESRREQRGREWSE